jgi:hypothetical protein
VRRALVAALLVVGCARSDLLAPGPRAVDAGVGPTTVDTGVGVSTVEAGACPIEGWCWVNPLPQGNSLHGVWASGPTDAWAVGAAGTIVHWDGAKWSLSTSGTTATLLAVWGSSAGDVWAVGVGGAIVHWDGASWSSVPSGTSIDFVDLSGSGPTDAWAVGSITHGPPWTNSDGTHLGAVHWDGKSWSTVSLGTDMYVTGVWATGADDVWAFGSAAGFAGSPGAYVVVHWDGTRWSEVTQLPPNLPGPGHGLRSIWASGPRDVRVYGEVQFHFDGQTWAPDDLGPMASINRLAGTGPSDVWAVGTGLGAESVDVYHFDGASWTKATDGDTTLLSAWATGSADAWAVGFWGEIRHWDGRAWSLADADLAASSATSDGGPGGAVWGSAADDVWVSDGVGLLHWDGRTWARVDSGSSVTVTGPFWGSGRDDVWSVGTDGRQNLMVHWDGRSWTTSLRVGAAGDGSSLGAVWGSGPRDVWAAGFTAYSSHALLYHWDGATWSLDETMMGAPGSLWGSGPDDVWAAGQDSVLHFDGTAWSIAMRDQIYQPRWFGPIWGTSADNVWLAVQRPADNADQEVGELHHWNGSAWELVVDGPTQIVHSFWGAAADDVWAIGSFDGGAGWDDDALLHFDGKTWTAAAPRASGLDGVLGALWGSGPDDIWAVGGTAILHHAGR